MANIRTSQAVADALDRLLPPHPRELPPEWFKYPPKSVDLLQPAPRRHCSRSMTRLQRPSCRAGRVVHKRYKQLVIIMTPPTAGEACHARVVTHFGVERTRKVDGQCD